MAKKKTLNKTDIMSMYMSYVLENERSKYTIYLFCKENKLDEQDFYKHFASFEVLEKHIFKTFFDNSVKVLNKSDDYKTFDAKNKLLSFYFTFFENLTANRSFVKHVLEQHQNSFKGIKKLAYLKHSFANYIKELDIELIDIKQKQIVQFQQKGLQESAWLQMLSILKFWMDDNSILFEKTDIFIEKSINTSFDILQITPLKSVLDLGKFLIKEKTNITP